MAASRLPGFSPGRRPAESASAARRCRARPLDPPGRCRTRAPFDSSSGASTSQEASLLKSGSWPTSTTADAAESSSSTSDVSPSASKPASSRPSTSHARPISPAKQLRGIRGADPWRCGAPRPDEPEAGPADRRAASTGGGPSSTAVDRRRCRSTPRDRRRRRGARGRGSARESSAGPPAQRPGLPGAWASRTPWPGWPSSTPPSSAMPPAPPRTGRLGPRCRVAVMG